MATPLDLQEQEQLDDLKAFWKKWGNLITWVLVAVLGAYAAWNGWNYYQRDQAHKAGAMFDELERAVQAGDADKASRVFSDLRERFPSTSYAEQGGLAAARVQFDKGQLDAAQASLSWVAQSAAQDEMRTVARLRLAGMYLDAKKFDAALTLLDAAKSTEFSALVADRRGDVLAAMGKAADAKSAYEAAYKAMPERVEYRRLIDAKLTALGAAPVAPAASGAKP